jgi:hypothetical protein
MQSWLSFLHRVWIYHKNILYIECTLGVSSQWHYDQVQKLVVHGYVLSFSLGLCGLILFSDFEHNFLLKNLKITLTLEMH